MDLYPAIDLRGGRCVRLYQGDYGRETVYGDDPVAQARGFADAGTPWIHVVDLDAARTGDPVNRPHVAAIAAAVSVPVQTGGGVRDEAAADALFEAGVARVVLGTAALEDPALVRRLAARVPVAVGLDASGARRRRAGVGAGERSRRARRGPVVRGRRRRGARRHRDREGRHARGARPRGPRRGARRGRHRGHRQRWRRASRRPPGTRGARRRRPSLVGGHRRRALYEGSFTVTEALAAVEAPGVPGVPN